LPNVDSKTKEIRFAFFVMFLASLSVVIPLTIFNNLLLVFIVYHLVICLTVPLVDLLLIKRLSLGKSLKFLGFTYDNINKSIITGLIHGTAILTLTTGGFLLFHDFFNSDNIINTLKSWGVKEDDKWLIFLFMILFNGIVEEVFWRGYLYAKFQDYFSRWIVISVVSLFYTSYHLATVLKFFPLSYISILMVLSILIAGLIWGWTRYYFKNIWASAIGHTLATIGYMVVYLLIIRY